MPALPAGFFMSIKRRTTIKTFKSIPNVEQLRNHSLHDTVESLVVPVLKFYADSGHPYLPENDGFLILIGAGDVDRVLDDLDIPYRLSEVPFEGVTVADGCFYAVYLANNQFALGFLIPDAAWLPGELRHVFLYKISVKDGGRPTSVNMADSLNGNYAGCVQSGALLVHYHLARRGKTAVSSFFGCSRFPKCRGTRQVDA